MKKIILLCVLYAFVGKVFAQKETFGLATFTAPKAWKKEKTEAVMQFSKEDAVKGTYCLIRLYKAVPGTANSKENFDLAWASLVKEMVTVATSPEMQPSATENGWETQSGLAPFERDGNKGVVLLVTASAIDKMINLIVVTNTDVYEKEIAAFLESVSLKKTGIVVKQPENNIDTVANKSGLNNISVIGSWGKSNNVSQLYNRYGTYSYNKQQYIFNKNGGYTFLGKNYSEDYTETILIKEMGSYNINGSKLTIVPKTCVIESWSKKNGADNWGQLKSSQKMALEKATYQVTMEGKNLILSISKETIRDGRFSNGNYYSYGPPETFTAIKLPGQ